MKENTVGDNAGRLAVIERQTPAGARADELDFGEMLRRAQVLAKTELVPKALQNKPEAIVLVGALGAELGIPFITSLSEIHVIEGRPSPSAQMRLALVRRAGHEAEFVESSEEHAVIRGRRRERADDPNGWVTVEWTMEQARRAGLTDRWVERWTKNSEGRNFKQVVVVGDRDGIFTAEDRARRGMPKTIPDWAQKALDAGEVKQKDNWVKYPADMLRARAASVLCRMAFSDVLAGLGVAPHTADEMGIEIAQDVDEPPVEVDEDIVDGEIVEPGEDPGLRPEQAPAGADQRAHTGAASAPAHSGGGVSPSDPPAPSGHDEQPEVYLKRQKRANAVMGEVGAKDNEDRHQLVHTATGGATQSTGRLTAWQVEAIVAFCDRLKMSEGSGPGEPQTRPGEAAPSGHSAPADRDNAAEQVVAAAVPGPLPGEWRARAAEQGVTDGQLLIMARDVAGALGVAPPTALKHVTDEVAAGVLERLA